MAANLELSEVSAGLGAQLRFLIDPTCESPSREVKAMNMTFHILFIR
jgi:hypothetical protein